MPSPKRTSVLRQALVALGASACVLLPIGCSSPSALQAGAPGAGGSGDGTSEHLGTVGMSLTLPSGQLISTVAFTITGPNNAGTVVRQGSVDVHASPVIAFTVGGIPAGSNYAITLSGTSTDGSVTCIGSASFSVLAGMTTAVSDLLRCGPPAPTTGSISVTGQTFNCAAVSALSALPSETTVGSSIVLIGAAAAVTPASVTYAWSAPSGLFTAPASATTNFTCAAPGPVTVTLRVTDGSAPDGGACNSALATSTVQINCDAAPDAGAATDATVDGSVTGPTACSLGPTGAIKHVIHVQFDNTHLTRDRAAVPSDLQQMPHLLNFIRGNGTMMANDHTILISHTAGGILSTMTGMYPDRHGQTVTNSYVRTSSTGGFSFPTSFAYWTDLAAAGTTVPNMVGPDGSNIPAPWVGYTRKGCDVGAVAAANIVLENTSTAAGGDVTEVFGAGTPQFAEATASAAAASGTAARTLAQTDMVGFAIHCAQGSATCASGETDSLPQEPGGYTGFKGLFGAQQIDPLLTGQAASVPVTDLAGQPIIDPFNQPGFPGFNGMTAAVSLAYVAAMQEHGVPVTYAYISDAHDFHGVDGSAQSAFGPGAPGYVQQLAAYDAAFAAFFARLAADGIDKTNTLFVFTVDEGDHFVGGTPTPANCDGLNVPCDWTNQVGELNANIDTLVSNQFPSALSSKFLGATATDAFTVHGDDAPTFYLARKGAGALAQTDPDTRDFERNVAKLTAVNAFTGQTDNLLFRMADQTGMQTLHMITTGDPARNATFAYFADDDYFLTDFPTSTCLTCINPAFGWNHGDDQSVIGQTWLGFVGPGVKNQPDVTVFTDHTDARPTIDALTGVRESYLLDGRVITQALEPSAYPAAVVANLATVESLGDAYKQINAPFGGFAGSILLTTTAALQSDDVTYASLEAQVVSLTSQRDVLAAEIKAALDGAEFGGTAIDSVQAQAWIAAAQQLLDDAATLGASVGAFDAGAPADAGASIDATTAVDGGASVDATSGAIDAGSAVDSAAATDASFPVHLDIYRVGDGTGALVNTGNPVFVDEYTTDGVLVQSIPMPTAPAGANLALVASGTATSEGLITLSTDGHFLLLTGYDSTLPAATSLPGTAAATTPRVVGRLDPNGNIDTTTAPSDFADGNNPRSAASTNGLDFWTTSATGGIRHTFLGSLATSVQLSTTVTNLRQVGIFGSQLYVSDSSGSAVRLGAVGSGIPTTAGQTIVNLPGFGTSGSPYAFFFADLDPATPGLDTLFVCDDGIGVTKYSLLGGVFTATGTVGSATDAYRGITGFVSGANVFLYATRKGGSTAAGGGEFVSLVDSSGFGGAFAATPAVLAAAQANTAFRGIAFAPQP